MVRYDGQFHCEPIAPGKHTIKVPTDQVVLFIRKGKLLPVGKAITNTREYDVDDLTLLGDGHRYELYTDDGLTWDCTLDKVQILQK
jgi:alpha-glucosidase